MRQDIRRQHIAQDIGLHGDGNVIGVGMEDAEAVAIIMVITTITTIVARIIRSETG